MFNLRVRRHRLFELNTAFNRLTWCDHKSQPDMITVAGTGGRRKNRRTNDNGGACNYPKNIADARDAMGIAWMTRKELSQAIPPAYTEYIGKELLRILAK